MDNSEVNFLANKRLKILRNRFTAWCTQKRGLPTGGLSVFEPPASKLSDVEDDEDPNHGRSPLHVSIRAFQS